VPYTSPVCRGSHAFSIAESAAIWVRLPPNSDYPLNGRGTTTIGTYWPRARPGFPIAAPVTWKQLERGIKPDAFHMF